MINPFAKGIDTEIPATAGATPAQDAAKRREREAWEATTDAVARANGYDPFRDQLNVRPYLDTSATAVGSQQPIPPLVALSNRLNEIHARFAEAHDTLSALHEALGLSLPDEACAGRSTLSRQGALGALEDSAEALASRADALMSLSRRLREIV